MELMQNSALFICSAGGFLYGVFRYFRKGAALFNQIVVCALGCIMLGQIYQLVIFLCIGTITDGFHVGRLGVLGAFSFLFSASFGQMDGLVDAGEKSNRKYRWLALIAPIIVITLYFPLLHSESSMEVKIVNAVIFLVMAMSSYYNLKHILIPDVDFGILKLIRGYNIIALCMTIICASGLIVSAWNNQILMVVSTTMLCLCYLFLIPVLERGSRQWTI